MPSERRKIKHLIYVHTDRNNQPTFREKLL